MFEALIYAKTSLPGDDARRTRLWSSKIAQTDESTDGQSTIF